MQLESLSTFPDMVKAPISFSAEALQADLETVSGADWVDHFVTQNYEGQWQILPLRAPAGETHPIRQAYSDPTCRDFVDTDVLKACPYFQFVLSEFPDGVLSVRLMALDPGSRIKPHTDYGVSLSHDTARFHIPITSNERVKFYLQGAEIKMEIGELWYLNLSKTHAVENRGAARRVHMVIDVATSKALQAFLNL